MELTVSQEAGCVVAKTTGAIDDSAAELFRKKVHPYLAEGGANLILDLSRSLQINSQGLGHLVTLVAYANTKSNRALLCGATPLVAGVFAVTKLHMFFEIVPTLSEAIART